MLRLYVTGVFIEMREQGQQLQPADQVHIADLYSLVEEDDVRLPDSVGQDADRRDGSVLGRLPLQLVVLPQLETHKHSAHVSSNFGGDRRIESESCRVERGDPAKLRTMVQNDGVFPCSRVRVDQTTTRQS